MINKIFQISTSALRTDSKYLFLDQVIYSLLNFILLILINKFFGLNNVGKFSLLFSIHLFIQNIIFSLVYEPLNIHSFKDKHYSLFSLFLIIIFLIFFLTIIFVHLLKFSNIEIIGFVFFITVFSFKNFFKKIGIQKNNSRYYFIISLFIYPVLLIILILLKNNINFNILFYFIAAFELIYLLCLKIEFLKFFKNSSLIDVLNLFQIIKERIKPNFIYSFSRYLSHLFITYFISLFLNYETLGVYRIFLSVLGVAHIFLQIQENIYPYKLSKIYSSSRLDFKKLFFGYLISNLIIITAILILVNHYSSLIINFFYSLNIDGYELILLLMSIEIFSLTIVNFSNYIMRIKGIFFHLYYFSFNDFILIFIGALLLKNFNINGLLILMALQFLPKFIYSLINLFKRV